MKLKIENLKTILLSDLEDKKENGLGFNVNGISFSLTLEQANSMVLHYLDNQCLIYYEGVEFITDIQDAKKMEAKIQELQNDVFLIP